MRTIKLTLQYDGLGFHGWQAQSQGERTVQGTLQEAVKKFTGEELIVAGSGRTDTGVHALGQVASFTTSVTHDMPTFYRALNSLLPSDVRVTEVCEVPEDFHPRTGAKSKTYIYHVACMPYVPPFFAPYVWHHPYELDLAAMQAAAAILVGAHDFRAFMAAGSDVRTTLREIMTLQVSELESFSLGTLVVPGRYLCFQCEGTGFLRHMVRNIVGTLVAVGKGTITVKDVAEILAGLDRTLAGPTAPACGLVLKEVRY
jgi:tRNA pseudouridine38-40 synthase